MNSLISELEGLMQTHGERDSVIDVIFLRVK